MRLIDADTIKHEIMKYHAGLKPRYISKLVDAEIDDIQDIIDEAQTVDAEPVRHGRWELCYEDWRKQIEGETCSACGFQHYGCGIIHYYYCPNCGAKMDGGAEK